MLIFMLGILNKRFNLNKPPLRMSSNYFYYPVDKALASLVSDFKHRPNKYLTFRWRAGHYSGHLRIWIVYILVVYMHKF